MNFIKFRRKQITMLLRKYIILLLFNTATLTTKADTQVLLDTRTETLALNWKTNKQNSWGEHSSPDNDYRSLIVCKIYEKQPNNWIRSNYIQNPLNAELIFVELKFAVRTCEDVSNVKTCREAFSLYLHETDINLEQNITLTRKRTQKNNLIADSAFSDFQLIETIAAQKRFRPELAAENPLFLESQDSEMSTTQSEMTKKTFEVPLYNNKQGFYIALHDTGACLSIDYIKIYYKYCPEKTFNFVQYPLTLSGSSMTPAKGTCIENSSIPKTSTRFPSRYCNDGIWMSVDENVCHCDRGFEAISNLVNLNKCEECQANFFKFENGPETCSRCPLNSSTRNLKRQTECQCNTNYYRTVTDGIYKKCTMPPGPVDHLKGRIEGTSINITWSAPSDNGGRDYSDIKYQVECSICQKYQAISRDRQTCKFKLLESCSILNNNFLIEKKLVVKDLLPNTIYKFKVTSFNSVSPLAIQDGKLPKSVARTFETQNVDAESLATTPVTPRIELDFSNSGIFASDEAFDENSETLDDGSILIFGLIGAAIAISTIFIISCCCCLCKKSSIFNNSSNSNSNCSHNDLITRNVCVTPTKNIIARHIVHNNSNSNTLNRQQAENTRLLIENRSTNGSCTTEMSDSHHQQKNFTKPGTVQNLVSNFGGTTGTASWQYHQSMTQPGLMTLDPVTGNQLCNRLDSYTNLIHGSNLSNNLSQILPNIPEIDVDDIKISDELGSNNEIIISRGVLSTKPNMNDSEIFDIPIAQLEFKESNFSTLKTVKFIEKLNNSKNCQYILKPEGKITIQNCGVPNSIGHTSPVHAAASLIGNTSQTIKVITEDIDFISLRDYLIKNDQQQQSSPNAHGLTRSGSILGKNIKKLTYNDRLEIINQCCQAIDFCHNSLNHVFDKLTIDNFVINSNHDVRLLHFDEKWHQITNLDMYKYLPHNEYIPSKFNNVWQFGCIIYEVISCPHAYSFENVDREEVRNLLANFPDQKQKIPNGNCSPILYKLMKECWNDDPIRRPNMTQVSDSMRKILTNFTTMHKTKKRVAKLNSNNNNNNNDNNNTTKHANLSAHRSYSSIGTLETSSNEGKNASGRDESAGRISNRPNNNSSKISSNTCITNNIQHHHHPLTNNNNPQSNLSNNLHSSTTITQTNNTQLSSLPSSNSISPNSKLQSNSSILHNNNNNHNKNKIKLEIVPNENNTCDIVRSHISGPGTIVEV